MPIKLGRGIIGVNDLGLLT